MTEYAQAIDVATSSELERLAEQVQHTRQPIPLTRGDEIMAIVQPAPEPKRAPRRPRTPRKIPRYPTLESLVGAAGTLPEPRSWKEMLDQAREDHLAKNFPPRHG